MAEVDSLPREVDPAEPPKKKRRSRWGQEPTQVDGEEEAQVVKAEIKAGSGIDLAAAATAARAALEKAKKAAQFQKQIAEQMAIMRGQQMLSKPRKLVLDEFGRELDEHGAVIPIKTSVNSTLQVNINQDTETRRKAAFGKQRTLQQGVVAKKEQDKDQWHDTRMAKVKPSMRRNKPMQFFDEGHLVKEEAKLVRKRQDKELENAVKNIQQDKVDAFQARKVKKEEKEVLDDVPIFTEIKVKKLDPIPNVEWWDVFVLDEVENGTEFPYQLAERKVVAYIEHPSMVKPAIPEAPVKTEMHLTSAERKKYRKLRKQERTREYQDKIKMGLVRPPPPKVKMSNLMRVLGDAALVDPSAVEKKVRGQMQERVDAHDKRNEASKLAPEERKKKKIGKWTNITGAVHVLLFKVKHLGNKRLTFKVDQNAQQYHMTGACVVSPAGNFVVVEGNAKAAKRYKRLMTRRIKWTEDADDEDDEEEDDDDEEDEDAAAMRKAALSCQVVWEGVVKARMFKDWRVVNAPNEAEIRQVLSQSKAEHYFDMVKRHRTLQQDF